MIPRTIVRSKHPGDPPEAHPAVLLIAPEGDDSAICQYLLEREGARLTRARTGREGLEFARQAQPQLVVLDTTLPDSNGYDLALELKLIPALEQVPVVGISAFTSQAEAPEPSRAAFTVCLTKPVQRETFTDTVRDILGRQMTREVKRRRDRSFKLASPER